MYSLYTLRLFLNKYTLYELLTDSKSLISIIYVFYMSYDEYYFILLQMAKQISKNKVKLLME